MRVFLSLKAVNPRCRYLSEGLNAERSDIQGNGYGKLVTDPSQLHISGAGINDLGVCAAPKANENLQRAVRR